MTTTKKPGRPPKGATEGEMDKITFRVDAETKEALAKLEATVDATGMPGRGKRSILLRRLILDAAKNL